MKYSGLIQSLLVGGALVAGCALAAGPAAANTQTFTANGTSGGQTAAATAVFTTKAGELDITLTNNLTAAQIISSSQAISDVSFTLSAAAGTNGTNTASGPLGTLNTDGSVTLSGATDLTRWLNGITIANNHVDISLTALSGTQPQQMILPSSTLAPFTNANGGVDNFNPYVWGTATFTLALSGVTANTTVSDVSLSFGTGPDTIIGAPGPIVGAGLPGLVMACAGLLGLARRRRRNMA